jgi:hypothetical protein
VNDLNFIVSFLVLKDDNRMRLHLAETGYLPLNDIEIAFTLVIVMMRYRETQLGSH